jgi:uncharacterized protein YicC (UPF0701 family)
MVEGRDTHSGEHASALRARLRTLEIQLWAGREELRLRGERLPEAARADIQEELGRLESEVARLRACLE